MDLKKWYMMLVIGMVALVLAACGDESAEEVYTESLDAAEDMESAEATMDMTQNMDMGEEGTMDVDSSFDMKMTMDPLAMHMDGTTSMSEGDDDEDNNDMDAAMPGMDMDIDMEIYMVDDAMYMHNEMMGGWLKMENDDMDMIEELAGQEPDPVEQMELFEDYTDNFSLDESDDVYTITLEADGEEFDDLFEEMLEENASTEMLDEMGEEGQEILDNADVDSIDVEIEVDKESYELVTYDMDMDMSMEVEGEEMDVSQTIETEYSEINEVDSIEVPDDVKDEAEDMGGMGF